MALRRPRRHVETAREVIDAIYRHGLVWAAATAVLVALIALVWRGGSGVLGAAVGGGVAVAFLAAGRAVHILDHAMRMGDTRPEDGPVNRRGTMGPAVAAFIVQMVVLGGLIPLLGRLTFLDDTMVAVSVVSCAVAWTVGAVVSQEHIHTTVYRRRSTDTGES